MIRLLRFLITGDWHLHVWETISAKNFWVPQWDGIVSNKPNGTKYTLQCKTCGNIKKVRT